MGLPYQAALEAIDARCANLEESLMAPSTPREWLPNLRERRDYWHVIGSRIRRRMARERDRKSRVVS
jgi:hypothetical protein